MKRTQRGNMLVLSGVFVSINAVALVVASSFGSLYFVHNRLQTTADELALAATTQLNAQDRIGQMNNMIARSRQLVNDADTSNTEANANLNHLSYITDQLHTEARDGAVLLDQERSKLKTACIADAGMLVNTKFNVLKEGHSLSLPWLQVETPTMEISYGRVDNIQSNVSELTGIETLDNADKPAYICNDGSKLYKNNINAKLTGGDSDLNFKLTSLPAPVQNSIAPARAALAGKFKPAAEDHIASAVQVKLKLRVATGMGPSAGSLMEAVGTAVTTGGQPMM